MSTNCEYNSMCCLHPFKFSQEKISLCGIESKSISEPNIFGYFERNIVLKLIRVSVSLSFSLSLVCNSGRNFNRVNQSDWITLWSSMRSLLLYQYSALTIRDGTLAHTMCVKTLHWSHLSRTSLSKCANYLWLHEPTSIKIYKRISSVFEPQGIICTYFPFLLLNTSAISQFKIN